MAREKADISEDKILFVCGAYPRTSNKEIAERIGFSTSVVVRIARENGITKDKDYVKQIRVATYEKSKPKMERFRKDTEAVERAKRKAYETFLKSRERDINRMKLGLKPLSRMKISNKTRFDYNLTRIEDKLIERGYKTSDKINFYYTDETKRTRMEYHIKEKYGLKFKKYEG